MAVATTADSIEARNRLNMIPAVARRMRLRDIYPFKSNGLELGNDTPNEKRLANGQSLVYMAAKILEQLHYFLLFKNRQLVMRPISTKSIKPI
jgi:hypothetical protein